MLPQQERITTPDTKGSTKIPHSLPAITKRIPEASSLKLLLRQLEGNQIKSVRFGFCESCWTIADYDKICKAVRHNSSLKSVEIGWELSRTVLVTLLDSIATLPTIESLALIGYTVLPRKLLKRVVSIPTLSSLELRNVSVLPCHWKEWLFLNHSFEDGSYDLSTITQHPSTLVQEFSASIQTLKLTAYCWGEDDVKRLCHWTQTREFHLETLSLAFGVFGGQTRSLEKLCQEAVCRKLDLTACDLDDDDAATIARCLPKSKCVKTLIVARNRLWESASPSFPVHADDPKCSKHPGFDAFIDMAMSSLEGLDLSYCFLSKRQALKILQHLVGTRSRLKSLSLLGMPRAGDEGSGLLNQILITNPHLRSLRLYLTKEVYDNSKIRQSEVTAAQSTIASVEEALARNESLEVMQIGFSSPKIEWWLRLNRAGRRYLRQQDATIDWAPILARSTGDPEVFHWMLTNGANFVVESRQ